MKKTVILPQPIDTGMGTLVTSIQITEAQGRELQSEVNRVFGPLGIVGYCPDSIIGPAYQMKLDRGLTEEDLRKGL